MLSADFYDVSVCLRQRNWTEILSATDCENEWHCQVRRERANISWGNSYWRQYKWLPLQHIRTYIHTYV